MTINVMPRCEYLPLVMRRNDAPWYQRFTRLDEDGNPVDFTGYDGEMQVRLYGGAPGSPLIGIKTSDTISRLTATSEAITAFIAGPLIVGLPAAAEPGKPLIVEYDIILRAPDETRQSAWWAGPIEVVPGVTVSTLA